MVFEFTQDCITGIDTIDEEHRNLFALLSKAYNLASTEYHSDYYQELKNMLEELDEYAETHFTHEEEYMTQIRDPELIRQRAQHTFFRDKIREYEFVNIDHEEEQQRVLTELVRFLAKWLYRHILSSIVDKANQLVKSFDELSGYDSIIEILNELKEYTKEHFSDEEEYMESIKYEGLSAQKRAHEAFIDKLENIDLAQIDANPQEYLQELLEFLLGWLINHILYTDKRIPHTAM